MIAVPVAMACGRPAPRVDVDPRAKNGIGQLWRQPSNLSGRNLRHGPGGAEVAPDASAIFRFERADRSGYSSGYDVASPDGRKWSVKLGPEAQSEVAASRILWAIGYHQPATYYVPRWRMSGEIEGPQEAGRFRFEDPRWKPVGEWSWYENPFVSTRPFRGLIVANLVLNNWDLKTSNNRIVEYSGRPAVERAYIVRDLGASLGRTTFPAWLNWPPMRMWKQGSRNDIEDFESQRLIKQVDGDRVEFDYRGVNRSLLDTVTTADVVWACQLMARLSDRQWREAFEAAGYSKDISERYVRKIKSKIAEGLALAAP